MNFNPENIVTINLVLETKPDIPRYTVVVGWSKEDVLKLAQDNESERTFTFPFYTGSVDDVPDWSDFFEYDYQYLVQPFYVQSIEDIERILTYWRGLYD